MTGRVTRLLRRPVFWTTGLTLGDVLLLSVVVGVGVVGLIVFLLVIVAVSRAST